MPWVYIYSLHKLGMVNSFKDSTKEFKRKYIIKGHSRDMVPLTGVPYTKDQLPHLSKSAG
jgi:hypothetical protein